MIDTTAPASTVSYSIVGCRESGRIMVEWLLGTHRGAGPGRGVHVIRDGRDAAVAAWDALPPGHGLSLEAYVASFATHWVSFIENVREAAEGHDDTSICRNSSTVVIAVVGSPISVSYRSSR